MNEILFMGINISKEAQKLIDEKESTITNGMNDNELKAYKLGVNNTLSALTSLIDSFDEHIVFYTNNEDYACEMDLKDLKKMVNNN